MTDKRNVKQEQNNENKSNSFRDALAPLRDPFYITVGIVMFIVALGSAMLARSLPQTDQTREAQDSGVVVFDTVKLMNAQRAVVGAIIGDPDSPDASSSATRLSRVAKEARATIEKHAQGRVVLARQAVVLDGSVPDITDAVLLDLGLPTDVPTIRSRLDVSVGDNNFSASPLYSAAERMLKEQAAQRRAMASEANRQATEAALP